MTKVPIRLPRFEREKEVLWIWWSVTRVPTSTTSLSRCSLGDGGRLGGGTNKEISPLSCTTLSLTFNNLCKGPETSLAPRLSR